MSVAEQMTLAEALPEARLGEILGEMPAAMARTMSRTFELMEVAEEEIARARAAHPDTSERLWRCFMLVRPPEGMSRLATEVYRSHCRELLERVALGGDTRTGTDAEMVMHMSLASLQAPPVRDFAVLYRSLFERVLPEAAVTLEPTDTESYEGAEATLDYQFRSKLFDPKRVEKGEGNG